MRLLKRALGGEAARLMLCWAAAQYIRLLRLTGRWEMQGEAAAETLFAGGKPFVACFWHGRMLMMPYGWRRADRIHMLISRHRDGQMISRVVGYFGIKTIAGSTGKGGAGALKSLLKVIDEGGYVCFTPDGPRGPRMRAAMGVVQAAKLSGAPMLPISYSARGGRNLGSWDRFLLPRPFTRGVFLWGTPIPVPRNADAAEMERLRRAVEDSLNSLTREADRLCGRTPVEPEPEVAA